METFEIITMVVALSSLVTSAVTAFEAYRQNKNSVRPVLVVLEKLTDNKKPKLGYSIFLVNMGHSLAMNVRCEHNLEKLIPTSSIEKDIRTEIAVGRRGIMGSNYKDPIASQISIEVTYTDINDRKYKTIFANGNHKFVKGK